MDRGGGWRDDQHTTWPSTVAGEPAETQVCTAVTARFMVSGSRPSATLTDEDRAARAGLSAVTAPRRGEVRVDLGRYRQFATAAGDLHLRMWPSAGRGADTSTAAVRRQAGTQLRRVKEPAGRHHGLPDVGLGVAQYLPGMHHHPQPQPPHRLRRTVVCLHPLGKPWDHAVQQPALGHLRADGDQRNPSPRSSHSQASPWISPAWSAPCSRRRRRRCRPSWTRLVRWLNASMSTTRMLRCSG